MADNIYVSGCGKLGVSHNKMKFLLEAISGIGLLMLGCVIIAGELFLDWVDK